MGRSPWNVVRHLECSTQRQMLVLFPTSFPRCCSVERLSMNPPPPPQTKGFGCYLEEDGAHKIVPDDVLKFPERRTSSTYWRLNQSFPWISLVSESTSCLRAGSNVRVSFYTIDGIEVPFSEAELLCRVGYRRTSRATLVKIKRVR